MDLNQWFEKGLSKEAYMERLDHHRESFHYIYNSFILPEEDLPQVKNLANIRTIVLGAEWCGHCMLDIPILLNIAETANIPVKFLPRDDNLELMDQYLTDGKRYIPIIIFIDQNGNELGTWGPMAPEIKQFTDELKAQLPANDSPEYDASFKTFIKQVGAAFRENETLWSYVYKDMKNTLLQLQ